MANNMAEQLKSASAIKSAGISEWIVPIAAVGLIFVMLVPLPSLLLDLLLATSITASVLVLLSAIPLLQLPRGCRTIAYRLPYPFLFWRKTVGSPCDKFARRYG